jgi:hypothetical protein
MPIAVEPDEPADPIDVRLLGANAVVLEPNPRAHLIEQSGSLRLHEHSRVIGRATRDDSFDIPRKSDWCL